MVAPRCRAGARNLPVLQMALLKSELPSFTDPRMGCTWQLNVVKTEQKRSLVVECMQARRGAGDYYSDVGRKSTIVA